MDWFQVLVIILSILLAVFLVLGIVLTVIVITISRQIQVMTQNAKTAVSKVADTATNVSNATNPVYVGRFVSKFISKLKDQ